MGSCRISIINSVLVQSTQAAIGRVSRELEFGGDRADGMGMVIKIMVRFCVLSITRHLSI